MAGIGYQDSHHGYHHGTIANHIVPAGKRVIGLNNHWYPQNIGLHVEAGVLRSLNIPVFLMISEEPDNSWCVPSTFRDVFDKKHVLKIALLDFSPSLKNENSQFSFAETILRLGLYGFGL